MRRIPRTSSPSNLSVFTSCLLSFLMLLSPVAALAASVKSAEAAATNAEAQRKLTVDQKTEAFLFNAPLPAATPDMSATMTDAFTDGDGDLKAEFGETITYTADISNDGPVDATGVKFDATLDPNTEFVTGSAKFSPVALNDSYLATKNTVLNAGTSVIANDSGQPAPTVSAIVGCGDVTAPFDNCATTGGGEVDMNADGTFTYTPNPTFEGTDTFKYTLSNGQAAPNPGVDDTATVTIVVDAAPTVTTTTPANGAINVALASNITVNFSENVNVTASAFTLECPTSTPIAFTLSPAAPGGTNSFTLDPTSNLPVNTLCTVTVVATEVTDVDSNDPPDQMAANYVFSFTTLDLAPEVTTTTPTNGATNLPTNTTITVNFSESVNATTNSFKIECPAPGSLQTYTLSASPSNTFTLTPTVNLPGGVTCTVTVIALQITDADSGDPPDNMAADYVFSFTTDAAPSVTSTVPTNTATNVASNANITVNFSETVNVTANAFSISCATSGAHTYVPTPAVPGGVNSFSLNPNTDFTFGELCTVTVDKDEVSDTDANDPPNNMVADYVFSFTVDSPPAVTTTTPTNGATGVLPGVNIVVNFNESVNATTNSFSIECPTPGNTQAFALSASPSNTFTLNPTADLPIGVECTVTVKAAEITDVDSGDPPDNMTADYVFTFKIPPVANDDTHPQTVIGNVNVNSANIPFSVTSNNDQFSNADPVVIDNVQGQTTVSSNTITATTAQGGTVVMTVSGADLGKYLYNPPVGYEGSDTFTYQITNDGGSDSATVTLPISGMVWFINNAASTCTTTAAGCGRLSSPFSDLASFEAANGDPDVGFARNPAANDNIFIYQSGTDYVGPVTLLSGQDLFGQDSTSTLAALTGFNPPSGSAPFPGTNSGDATIVKITSAANGINLNSANTSNTINGLTVGNTTGSGINGTTFGTLTVGDLRIDEPSGTRTGQALNLSGGANPNTDIVNGTFAFVEASGGTGPGIVLTNIDSTTGITITAGSLSGLATTDFDVDGGNASITYGGTITNTAGRPVDITNKTGGTVDFNGLITDNGGTGVNLQSNATSTIRFDGGLQLTTPSHSFVATQSGTLAITDPNGVGTAPDNTLSSTSGTALNVSFTNIHSNGLNFTSISAGNTTAAADPTSGIVLNTTGTTASDGALVVSGNGGTCTTAANCTGGAIQNIVTSGHGISLTSTRGASFNRMFIENTSGSGVRGTAGVVNFTFTNGFINNSGTGGGNQESNIAFNDPSGSATNAKITGTVTITNNTLNNARWHGVSILQFDGLLDDVNISNNTLLSGTTTGGGGNSLGSGIQLVPGGTASTSSNVTRAELNNNSITNFPGGVLIAVQCGTSANSPAPTANCGTPGSASNDIEIKNNILNGGGATVKPNQLVLITVNGRGQGQFTVQDNGTIADPMSGSAGNIIDISAGGDVTVQATVTGNRIDASGQTVGGTSGIAAGVGKFDVTGPVTLNNSTLYATINSNVIANSIGSGIRLNINEGSPDLHAIVKNNNVAAPLSGTYGIQVQQGPTTPGTIQKITNLEISGNVSAGGTSAGNVFAGIGLRKMDTTVGQYAIVGLSPSPATNAQMESNVSGQNPGSVGGNFDCDSSPPFLGVIAINCSSSNWTSVASVPQPPALPLQAAQGGVEAYSTLPLINALLGHDISAASVSEDSLTEAQLNSVKEAAIARWAAMGLSAEQVAAMRRVKFEAAELPGAYLAEAAGDRILVDRDASSYGWFVDATPMDDLEFGNAALGSAHFTNPVGVPAGRIDLLTVLMHELGHYLNLGDSYLAQSRDDLMYGYLTRGERRLPLVGQASNATPGLLGGTHHLSVGPSVETPSRKAQAQPAAKTLTPQPAAPAVGDLPVTIGTLPAGKKVRVTFEVTVKSAATYTGTNAFVSAQGTVTFDDPNNPPTGTLTVQTDDTGIGANTGETDPTQTQVDSQPDLFLSKSDGGATAVPGGTIAYTLTYNNTNGKREAAGVVITETVPANTTFNAGASTGTWNCTPNNNAGSTCTQTIGNLPAGDAGSMTTFAVTVTATIPAGVTAISNSATIADDGAKGVDGNPTDNAANDTTPVTAAPNLKIVKTADSPGVKAGEVASYTLAYSNIGNKGATGVVITDTIPADSTFNAGASTVGWNCPNNNAGTACTFTIGALAAGGSGSVTFAVTTIVAPAGTQVDNTASIADDGTNGADADNADNSDSAFTLFDDPPTLGNYSDDSVLITQNKDVTPSAAPNDDNPGFDVTVTVSAGYTGGATVNDLTGVVSFTNAGPAGVYTVTVKNTDNINQETTKQFQLTVDKSTTDTTLTSSKNPSFNNQNVTFTATVSSTTVVTGPPTGTVDFFDGATLISGCDDRPLDGTGKATCSTSTLAPNVTPHDITATYNGDAKFLTSTSAILQQTVNTSLNIEVNTLGDAADNNVADEICDTNVAAGEQCTLRAAIETANYVPSSDVITFNSSLNNQTINLDTALPDLGDNPSSGDLEITGPGATLLKVKRDDSAATQFRVFTVPSGKTATISGLTISGGDSAQDGGAVLNQGTMTLEEVVVSGNRTDTLGGGVHNDGTMTITGSTVNDNNANIGGGISNKGTMTVTESTINDNDAANGGGIATDVTTPKTLTITNSTISDNRANGSGGGLRNVGTPTTLTNVTIKDNRADNDGNGSGAGGGIFRSSGTVTLRNTIVAENYNDPAPSTTPDDISGVVVAASSFNLIGTGGAGGLTNGVNNNQVGVSNPRLGPLANNGGPTRTHALRNNSTALDAGSNALATGAGLTNDQRGPAFNRIVDSADPGTVATVDIGAFEAQVSIANIANQGSAEDTPLAAFDFEVQEDPGISGFTVTATSSDQALVPDANLTLGGAGTTRNLSITPAPDKFGTVTITVTVSGLASGVFPVEMTDTFDFAVSPVADTPDAADISTNEDTVSGPIAVVKNPVDGAEVSHFRVTAIAGGKLFMPDGTTQINAGDFIAFTDALPGLRFQPVANSVLTGHFTVRGATGNILPALGTGTDTSTITVGDVNDTPTLGLITGVNILEDSGATTVNFQNVTAGINESQTLQVTATSSNPALIPNPSVTYTSPDSTGSLSITPAADGFGTADITVTVKDNGGGGNDSISRTFTVIVANVNDAPTFTKGADQTVGEDSGAQTVPNWATSVSPGPNEPPEPLGFVITGNTNSALFSVQPEVAPDGTLTYTPATDAVGTAQITLVLKDFRTTENSGANTSAPQTFNITVNAVNDPPTLDAVTDRVINEDSGLQTVNLTGITAGASETGQTLTVTAASSDTAVIPNPSVTYTSPNATGSLSFTPVTNANGPVTITVTVQDNAGGTNSFQRTFLVTVREVNDAPTGVNDALALSLEDTPRTIPFSALTGNDTKGPANENGQALTITNVNAPTGGKVAISGTDVIFTPTLDYNGPASFTYTLRDDGTTAGANAFKTSTAQVSFTLKAVNDAPVNKVPGAQTVAKNGKLIFASYNFKRITVSDVDAGTSNVRVTLTATKGTITLPSIAGLTFVTGDGTDDASMSFAGTLADVNTDMNGMFFKPTTDYTGAASVKIMSSDMGHTPGPALTDTDTVAITVGSGGSQPVEAAKAEGSTFQFSAPTYTVSEGALRAKVTVKRTGDIASPAAVSYTTSDLSAVAPCALANGNASARCDYAVGAGKLRFAAGQSSLALTIPLVNDAYKEGPENFTLTLAVKKGDGGKLGAARSATVTIADDDEADAKASPLASDEFFVRQLYLDYLGREPDEAGYASWLGVLKDCAGKDCGREAVAAAFFKSGEFTERTRFTFNLYRAALGRGARYDELAPDAARLNSARTDAELLEDKADYVADFMKREEFRARYESVADADYVDALLVAAALPSHPQRAAWAAGLADGSLTRGDVLRQFAESEDVSAKFADEAEVSMQYLLLLRRSPDASAGDWGVYMKTHDLRQTFAGFLNSEEYRKRVGP